MPYQPIPMHLLVNVRTRYGGATVGTYSVGALWLAPGPDDTNDMVGTALLHAAQFAAEGGHTQTLQLVDGQTGELLAVGRPDQPRQFAEEAQALAEHLLPGRPRYDIRRRA